MSGILVISLAFFIIYKLFFFFNSKTEECDPLALESQDKLCDGNKYNLDIGDRIVSVTYKKDNHTIITPTGQEMSVEMAKDWKASQAFEKRIKKN